VNEMTWVELQTRITELETTLAYQDDTIIAMEKSLAHHQQAIQSLERKLLLLSDYIKSVRDTAVKPLNEETPPPHY